MGQRLTKTMTEPLTVRWANDDPNPTAVRRVKREREETAADAIVRAGARAPGTESGDGASSLPRERATRTRGDERRRRRRRRRSPEPSGVPGHGRAISRRGRGRSRRGRSSGRDGRRGRRGCARARRRASVEENAAASTGGAGDGAVGETPDAGAETTAPPPAPFAASVSAEELARINAAIGFAARAPGNVDDAAEDDEHEFDPDDYPTFEVEEVGDARS